MICDLLDLALIRRALAGDDEARVKALAELDRIVKWKPGDLIEYRDGPKGAWMPGVVVAWMLHQPSYVCGPGDDRESVPNRLLGLHEQHVRARPVRHGGKR